MYRPLPDELTIKSSPIEGLGLFATKEIKANTFIGITHIRDEQFENKYIRTPLGGFYNHSDNPTVQRMVSNILPTLFNVKIKNFFFGSVIGMTPQLFVGASLGAGLNKVIENNQELPSMIDIILTPDIYVPVIGMIILVLIGFIIKKKFYK